MFKWTNRPPDQFTVVEEKGTKFCVGQEDRDTLVLFFSYRCDSAVEILICLSWSNLQPTVTDNDAFIEVMRLFRQRNCLEESVPFNILAL